MRKGRSKTDTAGHIKHNTKGTSNEISFSVLDSMKGPDDEGDGTSPLGRISLFTLGPESNSKRSSGSAVKGRSPDSEIKARRQQRKRSRRLVFAIIGILCLIVLAFAGILLAGQYQRMQERAQDLGAQVDDVREQYTVAEPFLTLVETTLATPLPDVDAKALDQQLADWESRQQSIATKLRASKTALENLQESLRGADLERANRAIAAVNATIQALEAGRSVLTQVSSAAKAYDQAEAFLAKAMEADSLAREAASITLDSPEAANAAIEKSNAAIDDLAAARDAVQAVQAEAGWMIDASGAFERSAADLLKPFADYANLRIRAQEYAIQADEGYLELSSQQMSSANASYNSSEAEAAELIASLRDAYPTDIVDKAYEATMPQLDDVKDWQTQWARAKQELGL